MNSFEKNTMHLFENETEEDSNLIEDINFTQLLSDSNKRKTQNQTDKLNVEKIEKENISDLMEGLNEDDFSSYEASQEKKKKNEIFDICEPKIESAVKQESQPKDKNKILELMEGLNEDDFSSYENSLSQEKNLKKFENELKTTNSQEIKGKLKKNKFFDEQVENTNETIDSNKDSKFQKLNENSSNNYEIKKQKNNEKDFFFENKETTIEKINEKKENTIEKTNEIKGKEKKISEIDPSIKHLFEGICLSQDEEELLKSQKNNLSPLKKTIISQKNITQTQNTTPIKIENISQQTTQNTSPIKIENTFQSNIEGYSPMKINIDYSLPKIKIENKKNLRKNSLISKSKSKNYFNKLKLEIINPEENIKNEKKIKNENEKNEIIKENKEKETIEEEIEINEELKLTIELSKENQKNKEKQKDEIIESQENSSLEEDIEIKLKEKNYFKSLIINHFGINTYQKGDIYYRENRIYEQKIEIVEKDKKIITSKCYGNFNEFYTQNIIIDNFNFISLTCSCPVNKNCKHTCASIIFYFKFLNEKNNNLFYQNEYNILKKKFKILKNKIKDDKIYELFPYVDLINENKIENEIPKRIENKKRKFYEELNEKSKKFKEDNNLKLIESLNLGNINQYINLSKK
jgi:hypothetical protein